MPRNHLRYRNFHPKTVEAAEELFDAKPWRLEEHEQVASTAKFLRRIADAYRVSAPEIEIDPSINGAFQYRPQVVTLDAFDNLVGMVAPRIVLQKFSITTLFYATRLHLIESGVEVQIEDQEFDVPGWALSLFYNVRPIMFRARAREGRLFGVSAQDTYTADSWARLEAAGATEGGSLLCTPAEAKAILNGSSTEAIEAFANGEVDGDDESPFRWAEETVSEDDGLDALNRDAIRALAVENGIPRGNKNKNELVAALRQAGVRA